MNALKGTLAISILVLIGLFSANTLAWEIDEIEVDTWGTFGTYVDIGTWADIGTDLDVTDDATIGDDLEVDGYFTGRGGAGIFGDVTLVDDPKVGGDLQVYGNTFVKYIFGDLAWFGTVICDTLTYTGADPAYVLYEEQTRNEVISLIKQTVCPDKQGGAAVFFNKDTKRLEVYVASEGRFYDLQGKVLYSMPKVEEPTARYETAYYLDSQTGELKTRQVPVYDKYVVKKGYELDRKTGTFVNQAMGKAVPREEALELYVVSEGAYYDLEGNLIRSEPSEAEIEYRTEYYFDSSTGEVKVRRQAIRDIYVIKKGIKFDEKTGEFINRDTGEAVPKEAAIELKKG